MNTAVSVLAEQAKALTAAERVALAEVLLESVQESGDSEVEAQWETEIARRLGDVESGRVILIPSEDVYAKAKKLFR
jgi:putative addiction module component (TIGR02574 family)